jgi:hypothetical protein
MKPFVAFLLALVMLVSVGVLLDPVAFVLARSAASVWFVATSGSDSNSCQSPTAPCATINGALSNAGFLAGDTILVAAGIYTGNGDEVVLLNKSVTLSGGWNTTFTTQGGRSTIDGQKTRRGITILSYGVAATIERFIIQNGRPGNHVGGGIFNHGIITITNSIIAHNEFEGYGGGIYNDFGTVMISNTTVAYNHAIAGGGISNEGSTGTVRIANSAIARNSATQGGGGIRNTGVLAVTNSTISGNTADDGGGIYNSTVFGPSTLYNTTVTSNTARLAGGASGADPIGIRNTILAGNSASELGPDCLGNINSFSYNLIGSTADCMFHASTGDITGTAPGLGRLIGSPAYHPLLAGSPAIDAGNPTGCVGSDGLLLTDQRGANRVSRCDMGAYEYTVPGPADRIAVHDGAVQTALLSATFTIPLQIVVFDNIGSPVENVSVTFMAPSSGASGVFSDTGTFTTTAVTDSSGIATATAFRSNRIPGRYNVSATANGVTSPAIFTLSNVTQVFLPIITRNYR